MRGARRGPGQVAEGVALVVVVGPVRRAEGPLDRPEGPVDVADDDLGRGELLGRHGPILAPREGRDPAVEGPDGGLGRLDVAQVEPRLGDQATGREPARLVWAGRCLDGSIRARDQAIGPVEFLQPPGAVARGVTHIREFDQDLGRGLGAHPLDGLRDPACGLQGPGLVPGAACALAIWSRT